MFSEFFGDFLTWYIDQRVQYLDFYYRRKNTNDAYQKGIFHQVIDLCNADFLIGIASQVDDKWNADEVHFYHLSDLDFYFIKEEEEQDE